MSRKATLWVRLKNTSAILMPLILTSLDRIETISYAMELRAFGKHKKRTFYSERPFLKRDTYTPVGFSVLMAIFLVITFSNGTRFYNPFI